MAGAGNNVIPLRPARCLHDQALALSIDDLARAIQALEAFTSSVDALEFDRSGARSGEAGAAVSFQTRLPAAEYWLDRLGWIRLSSWPDTRWALRFRRVQVLATDRLAALTVSLRRTADSTTTSPALWSDASVLVDAGALAEALVALRDLIVERYPEVLSAKATD
jgi:hypothetical protein